MKLSKNNIKICFNWRKERALVSPTHTLCMLFDLVQSDSINPSKNLFIKTLPYVDLAKSLPNLLDGENPKRGSHHPSTEIQWRDLQSALEHFEKLNVSENLPFKQRLLVFRVGRRENEKGGDRLDKVHSCEQSLAVKNKIETTQRERHLLMPRNLPQLVFPVAT